MNIEFSQSALRRDMYPQYRVSSIGGTYHIMQRIFYWNTVTGLIIIEIGVVIYSIGSTTIQNCNGLAVIGYIGCEIRTGKKAAAFRI